MTDRVPAELRDLASAYVLGALDPEETRAFEAALEASDDLRREVDELREVAGLLALSAPSVPRDDDMLKAKLMERIRAPQETSTARTMPRRSWVRYLGWAAAAGLAVVVGAQTLRLQSITDRVTALQDSASALAGQLARREATLDNILEPSTSLFLLTTTGEQPPGIQVFWNRAEGTFMLHAFNLPPAGQGREYQLWFLRDGGVVPGLTFNSDPDGRALVTLPGPPEGLELLGAAVTEEPAGGSSQPTSAIIVAGTIASD